MIDNWAATSTIETLEIVHDHDGSAREWDRIERGHQEPRRLLGLKRLLGAGGLVLGVQIRVRNLSAPASSMRAHHAERDGEQIRAERTAEVQVGPVTKQNEKDLVREVLDLARARAEPLQSFEEVVELSLVDRDAAGLALGLGWRRIGPAGDIPSTT